MWLCCKAVKTSTIVGAATTLVVEVAETLYMFGRSFSLAFVWICILLLSCLLEPIHSDLGVITKGTIIEVNVSELGLVTTSGKVVWGKYAQVTNHPENDGCINAVLLV